MSTADYDSVRKALGENENVVVKCKCGDEIRRIPIMQIPTYDELCFILQRLFKKGLSSNVDNYVLRYKDDEGDLISLSDDVDIQHAISQSNVLRVTVYDKSVPTLGSMDNKTLTELKTALKKLQSDLDAVVASLPEKDIPEPKRQSTSQPLSTADMQELLGAKKEQTNTTTDIAPIAPPPQSSNPVTASPAPIASAPNVESPKWNNTPAPQRRTSTSSVYSTTSTQAQVQPSQPARQSQQYTQPQYSQQQSNAYSSQPSQYPPTTQTHQYPASLQPSGGQSPGLYPPNSSAPPAQAQSQPQQYPQQNQHYQGAYQQSQGQTTPQPYSQANSNYYQRQSYAGPPTQSQPPSQAPVQMPYAPAHAPHTPQSQQRPQYGLPPVQGQPQQQQYRY